MRNQTKRLTEVLLYFISKGKADERYNALLKSYKVDYRATPYSDFESQFMPRPQ